MALLGFVVGVLLLRSAPPIVLDLVPWTARRDAGNLADARAATERLIRTPGGAGGR